MNMNYVFETGYGHSIGIQIEIKFLNYTVPTISTKYADDKLPLTPYKELESTKSYLRPQR